MVPSEIYANTTPTIHTIPRKNSPTGVYILNIIPEALVVSLLSELGQGGNSEVEKLAMQYNSNYCMNGDLNLTKSGIGKLINKRYVNLQIKCDWMNKKCWKFAQFVDVKRYGKQEFLMANSGIDVKIVTRTKLKRMVE